MRDTVGRHALGGSPKKQMVCLRPSLTRSFCSVAYIPVRESCQNNCTALLLKDAALMEVIVSSLSMLAGRRFRSLGPTTRCGMKARGLGVGYSQRRISGGR